MARVLIVDDEKSIRITLREFLQQAGHAVDVAASAMEAQEHLAARSYDIVVTDVIMPQVSGVELMRSIRDAAPHVQVILMSGEPTVDTAVEALRADATDYLSKPIVSAAICRSVGHAVQIKQLDDEKRSLEEANQQYREELEQAVEDRTAELYESNWRLQQALEELKQTQQQVIQQERLSALGQLASGIAHDFNNVLMPILGLTDYLLENPDALQDGAEAREALTTVRSAAADAREIVRRLREFYRPDKNIETEAIDVAELVQQAVALTQPMWKDQSRAEGRTIEIDTDVAPAPAVCGNRSALREVLTNLLINAVQAMPSGGRVQVGACQDGDVVMLRVVDTGIGMPEDVRRRCLEPFFTTKGERGTGLGLAMCHGIVQRHGGTLEVASEEGYGTTVTLRLPLQTESAPEERPAAAPAAAAALKVLVVDDEEWSRDLLAKYLRVDGHQFSLAEDGHVAMDRLAAPDAAFDLVITDRSMPGPSGDAVAVAAKQANGGIPVIMLTGFGELMAEQGERPEGVDVLASKPITQGELREAIAQVLP